MKLAKLAALGAMAVLLMGAAANDPSARLPDPAKEARARVLFREVRCLVCQNESIDDSEADLADDLRKVVRQQVAEGRTDAEVKRYLVYRYGEFVLLRPSFSVGNAVLWLTPFLIVLGGGAVLYLRSRRRAVPPAVEPLSGDEEAALKALNISEP